MELVPCHTRRRQTGGTGPHSAATRYGNAPDFVALRRILPVPGLCQGRPWPLAETGENHRMKTRNIFYGRKTTRKAATWDTFSYHGAELQNLQHFNLMLALPGSKNKMPRRFSFSDLVMNGNIQTGIINKLRRAQTVKPLNLKLN